MTEFPTTDLAKHQTHTVDDDSPIDWHRISFPLGVRTEMTEADPPFLALHIEELKVLEMLLSKKLPGCETAARDEYIGLLTLATWARRAREWAERRKR